MEQEYILEMRGISKSYGSNQVLNNVDLKIKPGEIHALLGENGAGKSTLMNILFGMPVIQNSNGFQGEILFNGEKVEITSPIQAMHVGIGMVHQEFMLIPGFTIAENIKLNREPLKKTIISKIFGKQLATIDIDAMGRDARTALAKIGLKVNENAFVGGLPVGHMQFIEIAREIDKKQVKLLVFDEPTAVLTESEAENLLDVMKKLAKSGASIIFITHRLDEVIKVCDTVTILRDGQVVACKRASETNAPELAQLMVGRKVEKIRGKIERNLENRRCILELENFGVQMKGEESQNVNLKVYEGEFLGIGGLAGQGKLSIANGIMGVYPSEGKVKLWGEEISRPNPLLAMKKGCAFVSEDRRGTGLLLDSSIALNIAISAMKVKKQFLRMYGFFSQLDKKMITEHANKMIQTLDIRCTGPSQNTVRLSGGNQQKVCVARALTLAPKILFVSEPTRGIDIGAKTLLLEHLVKLNQEENITIIMTSSELAEMRSVCDRIAIISEGSVVGVLKPEDSDEKYGMMMSGIYDQNAAEGRDRL